MGQLLEFILLLIVCALVALVMKHHISDCPSEIMTTLVAGLALLKSCKTDWESNKGENKK